MGQLDDLAFDSRLTTHARRLGIESPLDVSLVEWKGRSYYHVSGLDREGRRVLIEVFTINSHGTCKPSWRSNIRRRSAISTPTKCTSSTGAHDSAGELKQGEMKHRATFEAHA